jgi:hypothetical protein
LRATLAIAVRAVAVGTKEKGLPIVALCQKHLVSRDVLKIGYLLTFDEQIIQFLANCDPIGLQFPDPRKTRNIKEGSLALASRPYDVLEGTLNSHGVLPSWLNKPGLVEGERRGGD